MIESPALSRRAFLKVSALAGGGLLAAWYVPPYTNTAEAAAASFQPNVFVRITTDNVVTIIVGPAEMGQGTMTSIPMLVAEELDADWNLVHWEQAPPTAAYTSPTTLNQLTAGSNVIISRFLQQRRAGAAVREMLVSAAARRWKVGASSLLTQASTVIDPASNRRLSYGELAAEAAQSPVPASPQLKNPDAFSIIGKPKVRLDGIQKSNGSAQYGIDVYIPNMLTAVIARAPKFGSSLISFGALAAKAVPGVVGVYKIPSGVAVVAKDFWSAKLGRDALQPYWNTLLAVNLTSATQYASYLKMMDTPGQLRRSVGNVKQAQAAAAKQLQSDFQFPYLAHAPMEPLNVVIDYSGGNSCEIWCGTQWPDGDCAAAASVLGLAASKITFHNQLSGGAFGRRGNPDHDFVVEAAHLAKVLKKPVKVVWTREDDIKGGYYRPCAVSRLAGSLDSEGNLTALTGRIATQSVYGSPLVESVAMLVGEDIRAAQGLQNLPYSIPNLRVDVHYVQNKVPVMWMRSVAASFNIFALETFIDELAHAAGKDPYEFRRAMLQDNPRCMGVLDTVAEAANWTTPPPTGIYRGIALLNYSSSYIAQVVEASVSGKQLSINKVISAVDCGIAINPDLVKAQIESGTVFGLSSALMGAITLDKGTVQQSNFNDYPILRINQAPTIETHIISSTADPGGVGELGVPCVAPALANAIFSATGKRIRSLPMTDHNLQLP